MSKFSRMYRAILVLVEHSETFYKILAGWNFTVLAYGWKNWQKHFKADSTIYSKRTQTIYRKRYEEEYLHKQDQIFKN